MQCFSIQSVNKSTDDAHSLFVKPSVLTSGYPFSWTKWFPFRYNSDKHNSEDCVALVPAIDVIFGIHANGAWDDLHCEALNPSLCRYGKTQFSSILFNVCWIKLFDHDPFYHIVYHTILNNIELLMNECINKMKSQYMMFCTQLFQINHNED